MSLELSNLRQGGMSRSAYLIIGAFVSVLSLSGVVAFPVLKMDSARGLLEEAEQRASLCATRSAELKTLQQAVQMEGLDAALQKLPSLMPVAPTEIELHSVTRLTAKSVGVSLNTISINEPRDTGYPLLDLQVFAQKVSLNGITTMPDALRLVDALSEFGYPCSVTEFNFSRAASGPREFKFRMSLEIYHAADKPEIDVLESTFPTEEMP